MDGYTYRGRRVQIAQYADIERLLRPDGAYAPFVQDLINRIDPWTQRENPIETGEFNKPIRPMTVPIGNAPVIWGVHRGHKAMSPGLSPFVKLFDPQPQRPGLITVEFVGSPRHPVLTRAYRGEYTPPLPWMKSNGDAPGGAAECKKYWKSHAYVLSENSSLIREGTQTTTAPHWFRS